VNYNETKCLTWIYNKLLDVRAASLTFMTEKTGIRFAAFQQTQLEDPTTAMKFQLIAGFCGDLLGIRWMQKVDTDGRHVLSMTYHDTDQSNVPFSDEKDLAKFWAAHIQKTTIDELCKLQQYTKQANQKIGLYHQLLEGAKQ
jgi:hypothetical protein